MLLITEIPLATPLAAYIRVPLSWYHSTTFAFFDDETHASIRRVYEHPTKQSSKRQFCGYCGTPLSFWCEQPPTEAEFIHLTLGSLIQEDLQDLEDMGLIPDDTSEEDDTEQPKETNTAARDKSTSPPNKETVLRQSFGVPWFDGLVEGTRLGKLRRSQGIQQSQDGSLKIEWEIVEYSDNGEDDVEMETPSSGKRKLDDRD